MAKILPFGSGKRLRCTECGNVTYFDVTKTTKVKSCCHFSPGGLLVSESEKEILSQDVNKVTCRVCGHGNNIEIIDAIETEAENPEQ